jgi:hypothetical protein
LLTFIPILLLKRFEHSIQKANLAISKQDWFIFFEILKLLEEMLLLS